MNQPSLHLVIEEAVHWRQITQTLVGLKEERLKQLRQKYPQPSSSTALRQALVDQEFVLYLEELCQAKKRMVQTRVAFEVEKMQRECQQSLRGVKR
jgi:hypothetical protein